MRICCFCQIWGSGGIESFLVNALEHMDRSGLEIDLVVERKTSDIYLYRVKNLGVGFYELSGNTHKIRKNLAAFNALIKKQKYDVLHLNIFQALSLLYAKEARRVGIPIRIAHAHGSGLRPSATYPLKLFLHWASKYILHKNITAFMACSRNAAFFLFLRKTSYSIIPNGIDLTRFTFNEEIRKSVRRELELDNCYVIGNVGRLSTEKNQSFLLDVLVHLQKKCPKATLLLVGDGEERAHIEKKARQLQILDNVIFYGLSGDVPQLLWAMDVFVMPSLSEGFGIAALEAQAAGLPVFCSTSIPAETGATALARYLPLRAGPKFWAEHIITSRNIERQVSEDILKQAGYDIKSVAETIRSLYTMGA